MQDFSYIAAIEIIHPGIQQGLIQFPLNVHRPNNSIAILCQPGTGSIPVDGLPQLGLWLTIRLDPQSLSGTNILPQVGAVRNQEDLCTCLSSSFSSRHATQCSADNDHIHIIRQGNHPFRLAYGLGISVHIRNGQQQKVRTPYSFIFY